MKKMIKFPSIEQFRTINATILRQFNFVGLDETGEAIYDTNLPKPKLWFKGSVKLHGTNAAVCYNTAGGLWAQSRESIITVENDNAGFAFFVESNKDAFNQLFRKIQDETSVSFEHNTVSIYGEWCGGNIQKGVAITNLPKSFFIFGVKISPIRTKEQEEDNKEVSFWVESNYLEVPENRIYNVDSFQTYAIEIDFNNPQLVQDKLTELTLAVEAECPIGKAFGFSGVGEGIVWKTELDGEVHRFKVKGDKHSSSKSEKIVSIDVEKLESIQKFIEYAVTESRFKQGLENVFPNEEPIEIKKMGELIKWVVNDVIKEETDTMVANNIEPKEVNKYISTRVREMFMALSV